MIKKILPLLMLPMVAILLFVACNSSAKQGDGKHFGTQIDAQGATNAADIVAKMKTENLASLNSKVSGTVTAVCQKKGCWMTLQLPEGEMRVTFKDYGFFVPKDLAGKNIVAEGIAKADTTSVDDLRHYAEDEGKSEEEIAKIIEPQIEYNFVADGVVIAD